MKSSPTRDSRTLILSVSALLTCLGLILSPGCGGSGSGGGTDATSTAPTISSFSPTSGPVGTSVTISGSNFTGTTSVKFGSTPATSFAVGSASQVTATVPSGATTGTISISTGKGMATSSASFSVTTIQAPLVSSFTPASGKAGDVITITGSRFIQVSAVSIAGAECTYTVGSSTQIRATVPPTAAGTGTLSVTNTAGSSASTATYAIHPTVSSFSPSQGPIGTPVVIQGTGFTSSSSVSFGSDAATQVSYQDPTQITAIMPAAGVGSKVVTVTTSGGSTNASTYFNVITGTITLDLSIDGAYITQSSQTYTGTVPLVAGRDGLLRVFVQANEANTAAPVVRARILNGASQVWSADIPAPAASTPTTIDEGSYEGSWNVLVPGAELQPGYTLQIQVDPANAVPEADETNNVFSSSPSIQTVKTFKTTLVQVVQQSLTGNVTNGGRTAASWADRLARMYPIQDLDVQIRSAPYTTTANLNTGSSTIKDGSGWNQLLGEMEQKRVAEASSRYYYGCVNVSYASGQAGLGYIPSTGSSTYRSAIGWDKTGYSDGGNYPEVFAHEVGHNFGRDHAPCGLTDADPNWPTGPAYATAFIGVWGWDPSGGASAAALKDPAVCKDVMSYCGGHVWVSDYTYRGVMSFRAASPLGDVVSQAADLQECLLVSGSIQNGKVELNPSFQILARPMPPTEGDYALTLVDEQGDSIQRASFEPTLVADLPDQTEVRHFTFSIPLPSDAARKLSGLRVTKGADLLAERRVAGPFVSTSSTRQPVATAMRPGHPRLSWDPDLHPVLMVRDPATGEVLAILKGGAATLETGLKTLELVFSDGVRSERRILDVREP